MLCAVVYHTAISVVFLGHVTALRVADSSQKDEMDGECQKKAVYHHDDLAPYGFGTQYNHFMIFYAVASLSERIPQEEGPWTLGCESESIHEGFSTCWLKMKEPWPKCPLEENNKYRALWSKRNRQNENHYEQNMVLDAAAEEWHFDAWPLRYLLPDLAVPCAQTLE